MSRDSFEQSYQDSRKTVRGWVDLDSLDDSELEDACSATTELTSCI